MRSRTVLLAGLGAALLTLVSACTSSGKPAPVTTSTQVQTVTETASPSISPTTAPVGMPTPVHTGPTTTASVSDCSLLPTDQALYQGGMRIGRVTAQRSGGKVVGCRLYGLQQPNAQCDATCLAGERLPPGNQPVIQIETTRYRFARDAHNAFVLTARAGSQPLQKQLGGGHVGVCYQTDFYPKDHGKDWACAFSVGSTAVVVKTVRYDSFTAEQVTKAVLPHIPS